MSRKALVPLVLPADPVAAMEAATKQYVDAQNEVWIGTGLPPGAQELWYDTDEPATAGGTWFNGKKWSAVGTSLTEQGFYTAPLASMSGMVLTNLGSSGGTLCQSGAGGTANGQVWTKLQSVAADAEVVTLETTNDWRLSAALGTFADLDVGGQNVSFYGALKSACHWLLTNRPKVRFFLITNYTDAYVGGGYPNFRSANAQGKYHWEYNDAVNRVASIYGVPVIDVACESGLTYYTSSYFTSDGLHLNTKGGQRFAEYTWEKMRNIGWGTSAP